MTGVRQFSARSGQFAIKARCWLKSGHSSELESKTGFDPLQTFAPFLKAARPLGNARLAQRIETLF